VNARRPVVVKFGGTSLLTAARVCRAARRVAGRAAGGTKIAVVVSARGDATDRILSELGSLRRARPADRETDRALATGEDLSAALFAAALSSLGIRSVSLRGAEAGIRVAGDFGAGRIESVEAHRLRDLLAAGAVPVVAGFQGGRADGETVTLGRGGSDTTAVALAIALGAAACEIVTDVEAVFDRDPRRHPDARPLASLSHEELLCLAEGGAQVVHSEAARRAGRWGLPLHVYSFRAPLADGPYGTWIRTGGPAPGAEVAA
jgi:aspartate kinase